MDIQLGVTVVLQMIETYAKNTHAKTHCHYSISVEDVFEIDHPTHSSFVDYGNR